MANLPQSKKQSGSKLERTTKLLAVSPVPETIVFVSQSTMLYSEIRQNTKNELIAVFDRLRKMEETMGEMRKMDETMSDMKTAIDQILQKLASPEPSLT